MHHLVFTTDSFNQTVHLHNVLSMINLVGARFGSHRHATSVNLFWTRKEKIAVHICPVNGGYSIVSESG
jgi:hypothetical protein